MGSSLRNKFFRDLLFRYCPLNAWLEVISIILLKFTKILQEEISIPIIYLKALVMTVLPFIILTIIATFWFVYIITQKKNAMFFIERFLTSTVICVFSIQPSIIDSLISLISCVDIGNNSYITSYLLEECYTERHTNWLLGLFLPAILLYAFIMPLSALIYMFSYKNHLYESHHIKKVGFLSIGYSYNKFYWEFIFFYRKIFLIFIIKYMTLNSSAKALLVILLLWISLWYQAKDNPYLTTDLNSVDFKATFVSFVTIFAGLLSYHTNRKTVQVSVIIVVFFFNLLFLYYWIRRILIIKLPLYMNLKYFKCFVPFFKKMLPEYNNLRAQALKVDLMHCMNASVRKNETPSSGAVMLESRLPQRITVFSHFKNALSKLIANAADDNGRNSRFFNSNEDFEQKKNPQSSMNIFSNNLSLVEPNKSEVKEPAIHLHAVQIEEPSTPIQCEIELKPLKTTMEGLLKGNRPARFDDDSYMQILSSDRKDSEEEEYWIKKKKNLLDRDIVDSFDKESLKNILVLKINEMDGLYDELIKIKKEMNDIQESNKRLERSLTSIKKHPIANKMSSINRFETRKNNVYFQEDKPQTHTFTAPPSDITKKPHFVKHDVEKQQIYREWVRNNSPLTFLVSFLSFTMVKETLRNKMNSNIIKIKCKIRNEITQKIDGLSIKLVTSQSIFF